MKRRSGVVVGVAIAIALIALWWLRRDGGPASPAQGHAADRRAGESALTGAARGDPRKLPRGSISGTVTDEAKEPVARAQVCTNAIGPGLPSANTRALACAFTDDQGHYKIGDLIAADYLLHASAKQFRPGAFHPRPGVDDHEFPVAGDPRLPAPARARPAGCAPSGADRASPQVGCGSGAGAGCGTIRAP